MRDAIISIVEERFPSLLDLAERKSEQIRPISTLQRVVLKLSIAQTAEEVREYLLRFNDE